MIVALQEKLCIKSSALMDCLNKQIFFVYSIIGIGNIHTYGLQPKTNC